MEGISLTNAKIQLSMLLERVEAGASFFITRRGKPVAQLAAVVSPRKRIDAALLEALTATMPPQAQDAASAPKSPRNDDRY